MYAADTTQMRTRCWLMRMITLACRMLRLLTSAISYPPWFKGFERRENEGFLSYFDGGISVSGHHARNAIRRIVIDICVSSFIIFWLAKLYIDMAARKRWIAILRARASEIDWPHLLNGGVMSWKDIDGSAWWVAGDNLIYMADGRESKSGCCDDFHKLSSAKFQYRAWEVFKVRRMLRAFVCRDWLLVQLAMTRSSSLLCGWCK